MKAVILTAGDNTRFRKENNSHNKLLHPVLGMPLIERTVRSARKAGIEDFVIVTGYQDDAIKKFLGNGERLAIRIEYIHNKTWKGENGTSVYTAREKLTENFILLMGDHLFDPRVLRLLRRVRVNEGDVVLAVDKKVATTDKSAESTKVKVIDKNIIAIGKELIDYNAIDTGMFLCSPDLFSILQKTISQNKFYLTDAMRVLAKQEKLKSYDIKDAFWADIDTHADLNEAEKELFIKLTKPHGEGPISKRINRHFSHVLTRIILNTPVTPNQITILSFLIAILSGVLLAQSYYEAVLIGAILAQVASIIDGVDGEVARVKLSSSSFGAWFDTILDRYGDIAITAGAAIGVYANNSSLTTILIGVLALTGSILSSYSHNTLKIAFTKSFRRTIRKSFSLPSSRDVRLFIIFLGGTFNLLFPALILIAFLTHYSVAHRLITVFQSTTARKFQ